MTRSASQTLSCASSLAVAAGKDLRKVGSPWEADCGGALTDQRWLAREGWVKMQQVEGGVTIHYVWNKRTGAVDDFKFKAP